MRTLIQGGRVVTGSDVFQADVLVEDERILALGHGLGGPGVQVLDASGCYVLPGGVDAHTHFELEVNGLRVADGFGLGSLGAAVGGTTTVIEHPSFGSPGASLLAPIDAVRQAAQGSSWVDYAVHGVVWEDRDDFPAALAHLVEEGVPTAKAYTTYAGRLGDASLIQVMAAMAAAGGMTAVHAENDALIAHLAKTLQAAGKLKPSSHPQSRPPWTEAEAAVRCLAFARSLQAPLYLVHLTTGASLAAVAQAKEAGVPVLAETCTQYLVLDESRYDRPAPEGLQCVCSPPLRPMADQEALWRGLADGTLDVVATDHCAFSLADKVSRGSANVFTCPGGFPGVAARLPLLYTHGVLTGRISLPRFVELVAEAPARLMGLPHKGRLAPGCDADICIMDPAVERVIDATLPGSIDYSPYHGMAARGWPREVLLRGQLIVQNGQLLNQAPQGRFQPRTYTGPDSLPLFPATTRTGGPHAA